MATRRKPKQTAAPETPEGNWLSTGDLCGVTGWSPSELKRLRLAYGATTRGSGSAFRVDAHTLFRNLADALATVGQDGPAAEADLRWRAARASREELKLAREKKTLVPVEDVHEIFAIVARSLKPAVDAVTAADSGLGQMIDDAFQEGDDALQTYLAGDDANGRDD